MAAESRSLNPETNAGWMKWVAITLVCAVIAFLAGPRGPLGVFWRPSSALPTPSGVQLPLFIVLNAAEAISFGIGIAFLIFGYPVMRSLIRSALPASQKLTFAAYLSIFWLLASWWPHDSLHLANGFSLGGLLAIEYAFHITLIIAGVVLATFFVQMLRQRH